jgi:DNA-binding IscR family transcriptional regulator
MGGYKCPKGRDCPVYEKLDELQDYIDGYFGKVTLADLLKTNSKARRKKGRK